MFLKSSRYFGLPTVQATDRSGRAVAAVKLRRLPATFGSSLSVRASDQLDVMSEERFGDATRYWRIADANSRLEANELVRVVGRRIRIPEP